MRSIAVNPRAILRQPGLLFLALLPILGASAASAQKAPKRYAQVSSAKASIRNLNDDKGVKVDSPAQGSLVAVYEDTSNGWSLVEVPGGFAVCVFGKYLTPSASGEAGIYEVTRNAVNIRPGPSSNPGNYPLPQRLRVGDRVRLIEKLDGNQPMAESWARIWSPPGVRAYIKSTELKPLASGQSGKALWASALLDVAGPRSLPSIAKNKKPGPGIAPAAVAKSQRTEQAWADELDAAREMMRVESKKETPNLPRVREMFSAFLAKSPPAALATAARDGLHQLDLMAEVSELSSEVMLAREQYLKDARQREKEVIEAARKKDPLGHVFLTRGVLFRRRENNAEPRYFLRFGPSTVAEVQCPSGRYNLEQFAGHQVGVQGLSNQMAALGWGVTANDRVPLVNISRIEITQLRH